jgi:S-adenosylhomocysteine hydrolase
MSQPAFKNDNTPDYYVADLSLANYGRKELEIAEHEMGIF